MLAVGEQLSSVQEQIERLDARRQALEDRVNYVTLTVTLEKPTSTDDEPRAWYETGVLDAFLNSIDGVVVAARALLVGTAYALPYLIVFGLRCSGSASCSGGGSNFTSGFLRAEPDVVPTQQLAVVDGKCALLLEQHRKYSVQSTVEAAGECLAADIEFVGQLSQ